MVHRSLNRLDKKILRLTSEDARVPFLEVARACNVNGTAIHQRIQKLTNFGVLKGPQFVVGPERIGCETCVFIGLNLENPRKFDDVVRALRQIPGTVKCHYTTGEYGLFLKVYTYGNHHLMSIIHGKLMPLGPSRSESSVSYDAVINHTSPTEGMKVADVVLDDDEENEK